MLCAGRRTAAERTHHRLRVRPAAKGASLGYRLPSRAQEMARRPAARVKGASERTRAGLWVALSNQGGTVWSFASPL